jgi:hypothetical protein
MVLTELNLTSEEISKRKTLLVPVPQFGKDADIMLTEMTIDGYLRLSNLQRGIMEVKEGEEPLSPIRATGLLMCAQLLSVMIHPETGNFLLKEEDLHKFHSMINKETLESLILANQTLNPIKVESLTLAEKKSNS